MREKLEGVRDEAEIRGNAKRTRVSTKTKAKTGALDIAKGRAEAKARKITHMAKTAIKAKAKLEV